MAQARQRRAGGTRRAGIGDVGWVHRGGSALGAAGCGPGGGRPNSEATLLLDFQPNAVHAGIYTATGRGFDEAEGVELTVQAPGEGSSTVKLLQANRAQYAILDIHDLALARHVPALYAAAKG